GGAAPYPRLPRGQPQGLRRPRQLHLRDPRAADLPGGRHREAGQGPGHEHLRAHQRQDRRGGPCPAEPARGTVPRRLTETSPMSMTDPISDMLTRIRNATTAGHDTLVVPASTVKQRIVEILKQEGYIDGFSRREE